LLSAGQAAPEVIMGWITTHRDKGITNDQWFQREVIGEGRTIVASSTIKSVYYAAVREDVTGQVWGLVCLTSRRPNREFHNFGWKSMTEDMGPNAADAPAKVLDALTETDSEYALEWRAECRANLAHRAALPKVKAGQRVRFSHAMQFSDGVERQEFELIGRNAFRSLDGVRVSISNWKDRTFEVVS
jgi:hypothetical protein